MLNFGIVRSIYLFVFATQQERERVFL